MRRQNQQSDPLNTFFDSLIKVVVWLVRLPFRGKAEQAALAQTRAEFQAHWRQINSLVAQNHWREAIMNADILLDKALQFHHAPGQTTGERLKSAAKYITKSTLDQAWSAHKVRNRLAHELHYEPTTAEAQQAINDFKAVLTKMGLL